MHAYTYIRPDELLKLCSFFVFFFNSCVCQANSREDGEKVGQGRCGAPRGEELSRGATPLRAAVALPDFPLIAFSWYLNPGPFGFWRPAQTPQSPQRPIQLPDPSLTPE